MSDPHHLVSQIIARHSRPSGDASALMTVLRETQEALAWLPPSTLSQIAAALGITRAQIEATAEFYSFFYTEPVGAYRVLWSDNIIEHMAGSRPLLERLCKNLWLEPGKVSEDGLVSVGTTSCIGMGDQGPALLVNNRTLTAMTVDRVDTMAELIRKQVPLTDWPAEWFVVQDNIRRKGLLLDHGLTNGEALKAAIARGREPMLTEMKASKLRGRGGAGFSTALKWEACRNAPVHYSAENPGMRYIVCNADEGEPGTFKDRVLLTRYADLVFEGMSIAGYTIGAGHGLLYLRGEYRYLLDSLKSALARRRSAGLLGKNILGSDFDFDIEIVMGAGAYICGEESALIESLEGKPGRPRIRPPFPVTHGYKNQPTAVNNVETHAAACLIAARGGEWYASHGTTKSAGSKLLSISGDCARPGVYEYDFGVSVAQVLADCGAGSDTTDTQAVQISGPSGITLAAHEFQRRIGFEDLPTAGAMMVFDDSRDMFEMARNFAHFFAHESCGFCTPCRVGTAVVARLMDKMDNHHGSPYDIDEMFKMHRLMQGASHCGLGNSACNPLFDTLHKFRPSYERRLHSTNFEPAFDLDHALSQARRMTGRDDAGAHLNNTHTAQENS
ncbi:MAG: NAD(P)H-dependent oxidoreductase subunit E [Rhodocyclaceae bacterium]|nr:NAD(P)H-dependent oxidoreductase subunit E [Rhodocyclaceae bacterium]